MGSKFNVNSPLLEIKARFEAASRQTVTQQREVLEAIGIQALSFAQLDYRTLSRRGTTKDGRKWKELAAATVKRKAKRGRKANSKKNVTKSGKSLPVGLVSAIGIDTGLQQASGSPGFANPNGGNVFEIRGSSVKVGYGRRYSKYFDETRKLLPDPVPDYWLSAFSTIIKTWLDKIITAATGEKK